MFCIRSETDKKASAQNKQNAWQKRFIDTILKINKINLFENIIISTHSPTIIGSHWDWTYDLLDQACVLGENGGDIK